MPKTTILVLVLVLVLGPVATPEKSPEDETFNRLLKQALGCERQDGGVRPSSLHLQRIVGGVENLQERPDSTLPPATLLCPNPVRGDLFIEKMRE
jgi:hypothetical protein